MKARASTACSVRSVHAASLTATVNPDSFQTDSGPRGVPASYYSYEWV